MSNGASYDTPNGVDDGTAMDGNGNAAVVDGDAVIGDLGTGEDNGNAHTANGAGDAVAVNIGGNGSSHGTARTLANTSARSP